MIDIPIQLQCPVCKKNVVWNDNFPHRPFCSDRCRLIDLGDWANENHRIAGDSMKGISSATRNNTIDMDSGGLDSEDLESGY